MENLFNTLCSALMHPDNKGLFVKAEGGSDAVHSPTRHVPCVPLCGIPSHICSRPCHSHPL